jgi:hypothetical protein
MFPRGFENAYAHEVERRKDEWRDAARHNLEGKYFKGRKTSTLPITVMSILAWVLAIVFSK